MSEAITRAEVASMIREQLEAALGELAHDLTAAILLIRGDLRQLGEGEIPKLRDAILALNGDVNDLETELGALERVVQSRTEHLA